MSGFVVVRSPAEWRARFGATAPRTTLSVGNFDGLHLGHQAILANLVARARITGTLAAVVTFDPHPLKVLRPAQAPPLVQTLPQRLAGMAAAGIDAVLVLHFDAAFAALAPGDFVRDILVDLLHADAILVGRNFRFGCKQQGDFALLAAMGRELGFAVEVVPPVIIPGSVAGLPAGPDVSAPPRAPSAEPAAASRARGARLGSVAAPSDSPLDSPLDRVEPGPPPRAAVARGGAEEVVVSSTAVRRAVLEGRVEDAARLLGRPFALTGAIETGSGRGRTILVPTLNLAPEQELLPKPGVYVTQVLVDAPSPAPPAEVSSTDPPRPAVIPRPGLRVGESALEFAPSSSTPRSRPQLYGAATNVGFRPTFNGTRLSIESHLFDYSPGDFPPGPAPEHIEVRFLHRLRDERKFAGPDELRAQIAADLDRARDFLARFASAVPSPKI